MDERILFDRFHQALDVEPRPDAYERLQIALARKPVKSQGWLAFRVRLPKMGLRLAAVMTVVVIAIAVAAAFVATHRVADRVSPADSDHAIAAYKLMLANDYIKVTTAAGTWTCSGSQFAACEAGASSMLPVANQWLNDLNRFQTPARFAVADAQLRRHIAAQNSRIDALIAASRAHDAAAVDREMAVINGGTGAGWGTKMVSSIENSRQGTVATYVESVRWEKQGLDGCTACQDLAGQNQYSCAGSQASTCQDLVDIAARQVTSFQSAVVVIAAPSSLAAKDSRLQLDLANADNALVTMADALATGDQAGFNAGRTSYQRAIAAINRDAADILNG
jgi:hypothetical protein